MLCITYKGSWIRTHCDECTCFVDECTLVFHVEASFVKPGVPDSDLYFACACADGGLKQVLLFRDGLF